MKSQSSCPVPICHLHLACVGSLRPKRHDKILEQAKLMGDCWQPNGQGLVRTCDELDGVVSGVKQFVDVKWNSCEREMRDSA